MRVIETEVFTFDELEPAAQERAREWYRGVGLDWDWHADTVSNLQDAAEILGFQNAKVYFSGFGSQGDGASLSATFYAPARPVRAMRAFAYTCPDLVSLAFGAAALVCSMTADERDQGWTVRNSYRGHFTSADHDGVEELARDFAHYCYRTLEDEWDYLNSDEQVDEAIRCNEYTFTADGRRFG